MAMRARLFWQRWEPWLVQHAYRVRHGFCRYVDLASEMQHADPTSTINANALYQKFLKLRGDPRHVALSREQAWALQQGVTAEPLPSPPANFPRPPAQSIPAERIAPRPKDVHDILQLPPRPFEVPVLAPLGAPAIMRGWVRTLLYGDTHFPHQDDTAVAVMRSIYQHSEADRLVHVGDLLDCYTISKFSVDPNRKFGLQDEIDMARAHLHQMAQLNPGAERWLLEGNHEDRLRKLIWNLPGGAAELARLTAFKKAMTWPELLGLSDIGWRFVSAHDQARTAILPKLIVKHGTVVRKWSGFTAKGEWEKYGKGGLSGHTHRLGKFYHRDHNGSHLWIETGCTCTIDPEYMVDPDWQQGCVLVTHTKDGERYHAEDIYIQEGKAMWRDTEVAA